MPEFRDLSHLPKGASNNGWPPDSYSLVADHLLPAWSAANKEGPRVYEPDSKRMYYTLAGKCARAISYEVRFRDALIAYEGPRWQVVGDDDDWHDVPLGHDIPEDATRQIHPDYLAFHEALSSLTQREGFSVSSEWTFAMGNLVHDLIQEAASVLGNVELEAHSEIADVSAHGFADIVHDVDIDGTLEPEVIEIKSINGYGFRLMVGLQGDQSGPKYREVAQGAMNALALDAGRLRMVYASLQNVSAKDAKRLPNESSRFIAEFTFTREEYEAIVGPELLRWHRILDLLDEGKLAPRHVVDWKIPPKATIDNPMTGKWSVGGHHGTTWDCDYCQWKAVCIEDGPGTPPSEITVEIR